MRQAPHAHAPLSRVEEDGEVVSVRSPRPLSQRAFHRTLHSVLPYILPPHALLVSTAVCSLQHPSSLTPVGSGLGPPNRVQWTAFGTEQEPESCRTHWRRFWMSLCRRVQWLDLWPCILRLGNHGELPSNVLQDAKIACTLGPHLWMLLAWRRCACSHASVAINGT